MREGKDCWMFWWSELLWIINLPACRRQVQRIQELGLQIPVTVRNFVHLKKKAYPWGRGKVQDGLKASSCLFFRLSLIRWEKKNKVY